MSTSGAAPVSGAPSGPAGGDLGGNYPGPSVVGLQGRPVSGAAPSSGQAMVWNGALWLPAGSGAVALIASAPVASGSVTFSSIPQTFSHLLMVARVRISAAANSDSAVLRINGDSITSYFSNFLQGSGVTASSGGSSSNSFIGIPGVVGASLNVNEASALEILIPNYTDTTAWRSLLFRCGFNDATETNGMIVEGSGTYPSTVAVSSLLLAGAGGSLSSRGPVCLYGIS